MPRRSYQHHDQKSAPRAQSLPSSAREQLFGKEKIDQRRCDREHNADETLQQKSYAQICGKDGGPKSRPFFLFIQSTQECPQGKRDGEREHDIGNLDAREEKQSNARGHNQSRIKAGSLSESPHAERSGKQRQRD